VRSSFYEALFPPDANVSRTSAAHTRVDPARTRTGTAYASCNTPAARTLRRLRSTFRERYQEQSNKRARRALINKHSSKKTNIHQGK
jgi:hypothetical protein